MSTNIISRGLLINIENCIYQYNLFKLDQPVVVALSGGKDSLFLVFALKNLGYEVIPISIDMGYTATWKDRIIQICNPYNIVPTIIKVSDGAYFSSEINEAIAKNMAFLSSLNEIQSDNNTPCTACYNTKILSIADFALTHNYQNIAFGHHSSDAISSFLKSVFMYIDRWVEFPHILTPSFRCKLTPLPVTSYFRLFRA